MHVNSKGQKCIQSSNAVFEMSDRFANRFEQDIQHTCCKILSLDSKSTNTSTNLAIDLLKEFCVAKGRAFKKQSLEKSELDGLYKVCNL